MSRELFWYREALLEQIEASWNEVSFPPSGLSLLCADECRNRSEVYELAQSHCGLFASRDPCWTSFAATKSTFASLSPPTPHPTTASSRRREGTGSSTPLRRTSSSTSSRTSSTSPVRGHPCSASTPANPPSQRSLLTSPSLSTSAHPKQTPPPPPSPTSLAT